MYPNQNYPQQQGYPQQGQGKKGNPLFPYTQSETIKGVSISLYASTKYVGQFYSSTLGTVQDLINALQQANIGLNDQVKITVKPPKPGSRSQAALKLNISFSKNAPNFQGNQVGQGSPYPQGQTYPQQQGQYPQTQQGYVANPAQAAGPYPANQPHVIGNPNFPQTLGQTNPNQPYPQWQAQQGNMQFDDPDDY